MKLTNRNIASDLMESTVKVIARDGFDKATTRNIAGKCDISDAYIYVYFKDKDDLFAKAFQKEDMALAEEVRKHLPILNQAGISNENRLYFLFCHIWTYLLAYPDSCRFYVQYYYSPYYQKYSAQEHLARWMPIVKQMEILFQPGTDVKKTLWIVLNILLDQAIKAIGAPATDKNTIAQNNYELILGVVRACLLDD